MQLRYLGPAPTGDATIPLPEGWPAADHDEPDEGLAAAKVASGLYAEAPGRGRRRKDSSDEEVTDASD